MKQKDNSQYMIDIEDRIKKNEDSISFLIRENKKNNKEIRLLNSCISDIFSELFNFECKYCNGKFEIIRKSADIDPYNVYVFNKYSAYCECGVNTKDFHILEDLIEFLKDKK